MLNDWGDSLGLKGSGSQSVRFEKARIPARFVLAKEILNYEVPVQGAVREHGDSPMYYGRFMSFLMLEPASIMIGAVQGALDEYANFMRTRTTMRPPIVLRSEDADYRRWYGTAIAKLAAAEALVLQIYDQWTDAARRNMTGEAPFTMGDDLRLVLMAREAINMGWDIMQDILWRTAGSSPARDGERMQRVFRDTAMIRAHALNTYFDTMTRELADEALGTGSAGESFATRY